MKLTNLIIKTKPNLNKQKLYNSTEQQINCYLTILHESQQEEKAKQLLTKANQENQFSGNRCDSDRKRVLGSGKLRSEFKMKLHSGLESVTSSNLIYMDFPKNEHSHLTSRLNQGLPTYTTRVSKEQGKYNVDQTVQSPFGKLHIEEVRTFNNINQHPFKNELTEDQLNQIVGKFDLIKISKTTRGRRDY